MEPMPIFYQIADRDKYASANIFLNISYAYSFCSILFIFFPII